jgi:hypothetical protein
MSNTVYLSRAIKSKLDQDTYLQNALGSLSVDISTGETKVTIAESSPENTAQVPFVGFTIGMVRPITRGSIEGVYRAKVIIRVTTKNSLKTRYIADRLQTMMAEKPQGATNSWFFDISDDCLSCRNSTFLDRFDAKPKRFNDKEDTFSSILEIEFIYASCPCSGVQCDMEMPQECETNIEDYDIDFGC